jgi:hypothetical protein
MRVQKLREDVAEKKRDRHFNTIQSMILTKQEWRMKEKTSTPCNTHVMKILIKLHKLQLRHKASTNHVVET